MCISIAEQCVLFVLVIISLGAVCVESKTVTVNAYMPKITTDVEDDYVMTSAKLPAEEMYITDFLPKVDESKAHHMLIYLCSQPSSGSKHWHGSTCGAGEEMLVFAYAHGGRKFHMPKGVGFRAGGLRFQYVVVQMHYRVVVKDADSSGLSIVLSSVRPAMFAGMLLGAGNPEIPPHKEKVITPGTCTIADGQQRMTVFAYRVHTHLLGRRVAAWRVRDGKKVKIVDHDPQKGQYFRSIAHVDLLPGDTINFQCEYNSMNQNHYVSVGATHRDEMCNLYLMYHSAMPSMMECVGGTVNSVIPKSLGAVIGAPDLNPHPHALGQVTGATFAPNGDLFVFHRADRKWDFETFNGDTLAKKFHPPIAHDTVLIFDKQGKLKGSWGKGETYLPHGIAADPNGGIWITDVGSHEVVKFSNSGKRLITLGTHLKAGSGKKHFCKPTDIAISKKDGSVYIADGYCNARVVKYSSAGVYLAEFGKGFSVAHSIAIDALDRVYLADRENKRLVRFTSEGKKIDELKTPDGGLLFGVALGTDCISKPDLGLMKDASLQMGKGDPLIFTATTDQSWSKGRITTMLPSTQVLQTFGDGDDKTEAIPRLSSVHAVAVAPGCTSVVVPQLNPGRIARFTLALAPTSGLFGDLNSFGVRDDDVAISQPMTEEAKDETSDEASDEALLLDTILDATHDMPQKQAM
jgi:peptidylamidoglycolate lyase